MALTDEEFREEYKPLQVPASFFHDDTQENQIIFALAELGEGTVTEVVAKFEEFETGNDHEQLVGITKHVLTHLYDKGLISGIDLNGQMHYNLNKITHANSGATTPPNH
jgi:hypothetical protein